MFASSLNWCLFGKRAGVRACAYSLMTSSLFVICLMAFSTQWANLWKTKYIIRELPVLRLASMVIVSVSLFLSLSLPHTLSLSPIKSRAHRLQKSDEPLKFQQDWLRDGERSEQLHYKNKLYTFTFFLLFLYLTWQNSYRLCTFSFGMNDS